MKNILIFWAHLCGLRSYPINSQRGTIYSQEYCSARTITVAGTRLTKGLLTANLDQIKTQQHWITNIVFHICQDKHLWQTKSKMDETTRIEFSIFYNLLHYKTWYCTYNECKCHFAFHVFLTTLLIPLPIQWILHYYTMKQRKLDRYIP